MQQPPVPRYRVKSQHNNTSELVQLVQLVWFWLDQYFVKKVSVPELHMDKWSNEYGKC